ncbi:MAG TPA: Kdo hydroxylase family protein [Burkholderiales bacterium]|nr:Kdo hydroxylase family protein [Burkholderiales bacterium]
MGVDRFPHVSRWDHAFDPQEQDDLLDRLENGQVLLFDGLRFALSAAEQDLLAPTVSDGRSKNVAVDPSSGKVSGSALEGAKLEALRQMVTRFSALSRGFLERLLPRYAQGLETRLASYRPVAVVGRETSRRKDDARLHVDAFASRPNQGRRILRVFCNVNPEGLPRTWLVGEPFEGYARRFAPQVRRQLPLEASALRALGVTKSRRTGYDHLMLGLHDRGKLDEDYQRDAWRERFDFPAGSTWVCFTDQVLHAALGGQYLLEQTFMLPVSAMLHAERSPLRVLERLSGRRLAEVV